MTYTVKDSGERKEFSSGMVRDVTEDKTNWSLVADGPMLERWAEHMTKGASKYSARNWMMARSNDERERFRESAFRHFMQWYAGEADEDHASAVFFNINGAEYVKEYHRWRNPDTLPPVGNYDDLDVTLTLNLTPEGGEESSTSETN